ncbi:MAG: cadherin-like beta sandwich domain-containing protein, partial [Clostridia bacterium]|nr:cadherin-like beta sandwich domain-containing protein [Clostridia bacterium]
NLASIKLSSGSLSPAFNPNTTDYNVTVKYDVDSITITGAVADGKATYIGGGTFALEVGDNKKTLTVTAEDGTKKSYTINIKRMTEQETKDAEQAERDANPLLVIIDGVDYTIVNDLESVNIPAGFTLGKSTRKDTEITVLNDDCGEYQLYYLTDTEGNGAFYTRDENDKFTRISYINANGKFYIIEEIDVLDTLPTGYVVANRVVDGIDVKVYAHNSDELKDLWIIKCYVNGQRAYYQFDSAEGTVQRALEFDLAVKETENIVDTQQQDSDKKGFGLFGDMNVTGIIVLVGVVFVALLFIVVAVLIIIKIATSGKNDYDDYIIPTDAEFSLNDFAQNVSNDEETTSEEPEANDK